MKNFVLLVKFCYRVLKGHEIKGPRITEGCYFIREKRRKCEVDKF